MTAIQAIYIKGHEERPTKATHSLSYRHPASVRSWSMWRRYSEFVELHTELTKSLVPTPASLPPKHTFSILRIRPLHDRDEGLLEERRAGLETYLRAIVALKNDRWRELCIPRFPGYTCGETRTMDGAGRGSFSSSSWLDEHLELQNRIRDVRADINSGCAV